MEIPSCSITSAIACLISGRKNGEPQEVVLLKLIKEISRINAGLSTTSAARSIRESAAAMRRRRRRRSAERLFLHQLSRSSTIFELGLLQAVPAYGSVRRVQQNRVRRPWYADAPPLRVDREDGPAERAADQV